MRRIICLLLPATLLLFLMACGNTNTETELFYNGETTVSESNESEDKSLSDKNEISESDEGERILVEYFSWADNAEQGNIDAVTSASVTVPGNVAQFAAWTVEKTGGDLFPIQVVESYPAEVNRFWSRIFIYNNKKYVGIE